ncbi:ribokinase [Xylanibacillus composti]|uniref:Ribokinase n=2 Tax=Xylanibacillus composti TaxID=1572762 RepID=A0A8J4H2Q9_9BACL|nr:ribokinase [Xylanibacillus composti]GIQ69902.1 ribokinase [Xylanibacillus composti]
MAADIRQGIAVIGSVNMDIVNRVKAHPQPGETIHGLGTSYFAGGKGANQAVAAARSGAAVWMVGAVGKDDFGRQLMDGLQKDGVQVTAMEVKEGHSGMAFIAVDDGGENSIILSPGANGEVTAEDVVKHWPVVLEHCRAILLQNEIPWPATAAAIHAAAEAGVKVYLNPAPACEVPASELSRIDVLIVNESEAAAICGIRPHDEATARHAAAELVRSGVKTAIVTMGERGACYADVRGQAAFVPAFRVQAVDTTGAGDTFIGAFCAAYETKGMPVPEAMRFAAAASAIAVTRSGAQAAIPREAEIIRWLAAHAR